MQVQTNKCPECGVEMELRLGMLACPGCGQEMEPPPVEVEEEEDDGRPLRRLEGWQRPTGKPLVVSADPVTPTFHQGLADMVEKEPRRDSAARELSAEKIFVVALFFAISCFNVATAYQDEFTMAVVRHLPWVGALALELLRLGLTILALYYPFPPLKWCAIATVSLGLIHALINIWLLFDNRSLFLEELPIGLYTNLFEINTWMMYWINVAVFAIFLSVLGRDVQKISS